ncbi:unnamed protein product [Closterium sp. NIES-65]|nr:unnamed protein product [Closterium sp. NIES-65]
MAALLQSIEVPAASLRAPQPLRKNQRLSSLGSISLQSSRSLSSSLIVKSHVSTKNFRNSRRVACRAAAGESGAKKASLSERRPEEVNVVVVGPTGYIGKFVTRELIKRGYNVTAVARERSGIGGKKSAEDTAKELEGATMLFADVTSEDALSKALAGKNVDVVVSCLASRTGGIKDSWLIDYTATKNSLEAGKKAGATHFVLLSAICVQRPLLEFQRAKLKFEKELQEDSAVTHSIVRPTAFFKSLGGQVESVKGGGPYVMFGDGQLCACKPISEADLAAFIADCVQGEDKVNKVLPIGGPGEALTPLQQGEMLFQVVGKEPKFIKVPIGVMDFVIGILDVLAKPFPSLADAAEFGKIGRYYAAESMLVWDEQKQRYDADATPSYGSDTLRDFFEKVVRDGMEGQELGDQAVFK